MSNGAFCNCEKKDKSNWVVSSYKSNYSHFEYPKGERHYSDYSQVECKKCGRTWRTKAKYVEEL
jgi:hypothetical protein